MTRVLLLCGVVVCSAAGALTLDGVLEVSANQQATAREPLVTSRVIVTVPQDQTEIEVDGQPIPGAGTVREFETPPLAVRTHQYTFIARWQPNTYTAITRSRTVSFRAGERVTVDLTLDHPSDRIRVVYVPTPSAIVDEMVKLAGVSAADVVYEPGCGDARITIAAVKGGARKGVGIDIDPERVEESRARVAEAGLADRIEVRLGDALDIKDLSTATVVFLYMGDHFNLLIRPILWKELRVGARVVSHRFTMGDWKPDRTVTVSSAESGSDYELHLWTVTEELKRKGSVLVADQGPRVAMRFEPQSPAEAFVTAAAEYDALWKAEGELMLGAMERMTGVTFAERDIKVVIFEGASFSGYGDQPMHLRASYPADVKKATLIHELLHRMLGRVQATGEIDEHRKLFLVLYDIWVALYGKAFADDNVAVESKRKGIYDYESAWKWALAMSPEERAAKFRALQR